jgi:hypothetical protein
VAISTQVVVAISTQAIGSLCSAEHRPFSAGPAKRPATTGWDHQGQQLICAQAGERAVVRLDRLERRDRAASSTKTVPSPRRSRIVISYYGSVVEVTMGELERRRSDQPAGTHGERIQPGSLAAP